jgi:hypothetical protein
VAGEIEVGLKVTGQKDLKNVRLEALKLQAATGLAAAKNKRLANTFDKELGPALRDVNRKMKQNLVLQQQSQKGNRRLALLTQQAGYQFGDLAVQIQGGTNAAVAFGQQMSQLAGFFGPAGAIFGLGIALSTAIIAPLIRAREAANEFVEELKGVNEELELLRSGASSKAVLSANNQVRDIVNKIYELENKTYDTTYMTAEMKKDFLATVEDVKAADQEHLETLKQQLVELGLAKDALGIVKGLIGDQVSEEENLRQARRIENQERIAREKAFTEVLIKEAQRRAGIREKDNKSQAKKTLDQIAAWHQAYVEQTEAVEDESRRRRKEKEENYLTEMADFFLAMQERNRKLYYSQFAAEDALMSQDVVSGPAVAWTDRFGADDLLRMGYTKEYLIAIGKLKEEEAEKTKKVKFEVKELTQAQKEQFALVQRIEQSMENSFMSMVDGTKSVSDAFRSMASEIIKELYRIFVVKKITGMISGYMSDPAMFGGMGGNAPMGSVRPQARSFDGGGYTGGGSRSGGLDGKGGFMAMLHPKETVVDHTKGQSGGGVTIVQNINVSTGVQQTVRAEIRQMMPQIAQSAKAAVVDSKRRGGNYGRAMA